MSAEAVASLTLLTDLVASARKAGADAADAVLVEGESLSVAWRLGALETLERADGGDIGLRVFVGRRQAVVSSGDRSKQALRELVERAVAMARAVPEDPWVGLADPDQVCLAPPALDLADPVARSAEDLEDLARRAEDAARAVRGVTNSEGAEASWGRSRVVLAASNGFHHTYERSSCSVSAVALAGSGTAMERDYDYTTAVYWDDLRPAEDVGHEAGRRAVRRLNARRPRTARVPVVFEPRLARGLVSSFLGAINGASVARGTTFLRDALDTAVFAPGVVIREDPHRRRGLKSKPVDGEGLPTHRRAIVDDGVLTTWILDLRSARQLGLNPTGHGARGTGGPPSPAASNVWLEPGPLTLAEMVGDITDGLYVTDLFGHGINGVTGDYSRGCAGFWIENGELAWPVHEATIAGNLRDMFRNLTPASDLEVRFGTDAPSVRIDGLTVAGA